MPELRVVAPPDSDPVTVAEAKKHMRVEHDEEDEVIAGMVGAATEYIEKQIGRALVSRDYELSCYDIERLDRLPIAPVQQVLSLTYYSPTDGVLDAQADDFTLVSALDRPRVRFGGHVTNRDVVIRFRAGYGTAADVPRALKHAVLLMAGHFYEHREAVTMGGGGAFAVPMTIESLINPYRVSELS